MADKSLDICPTFYKEDVLTTTPGTIVLGFPVTIWAISVVLETTGSVVLNLSDDANGYNPLHRIGKIVFSGPDTESLNISKGLSLTRGLSVQSNITSVDIYGIYE